MIRLYTFLIFVAIGTTILYAIFVMPKADFVGKTSVLVVPENTAIAVNMDGTVNDIVFVAEIAADGNEDVKENNADVEITRIQDHNIINIFVYASSKKDVRFIENSVLASITKDLKKYYSAEENFTISIIEKERTQQTMSALYAPYILMIIITVGLIAGVLALFYLWDIMNGRSENEEKNIDGERVFAHYNDSKQMTGEIEYENNVVVEDEIDDVVEAEQEELYLEEEAEIASEVAKIEEDVCEIEKIEIQEEVDQIINDSEHLEDAFKSVSAPGGLPTTPGNLPIADLSDFGAPISETDGKLVEDEASADSEPTEEELKARLNELLNGKL